MDGKMEKKKENEQEGSRATLWIDIALWIR